MQSKEAVLAELKQDLYEASNGYKIAKQRMEKFEVRMDALSLVIEQLEKTNEKVA